MLSGTVLLIPKKAFEAVYKTAADRRGPPGNTPTLLADALVIKSAIETAGCIFGGDWRSAPAKRNRRGTGFRPPAARLLRTLSASELEQIPPQHFDNPVRAAVAVEIKLELRRRACGRVIVDGATGYDTH